MFDNLLIMEAVVYRRQAAEAGEPDTDRFGQPYKVNRLRQPSRDEEEIARYPCRATAPSGGEQMQERYHDVVQENRTLYFENDADVRESDVVSVIDPAGATIVERAEVILVKRIYDGVGFHHLEVACRTQRPSSGITRIEAGVS